jgi:hypothetical protein
MASRPRACDRCAELKAQCSGGEPCSRCQRLDVACTMRRPLRSRGRPKTGQTGSAATQRARRATSVSATVADSDSQRSPVEQYQTRSPPTDLPIDSSMANELLDRICSNLHHIGILSAFRRQHHCLHPDSSFLATRAVRCTLLACAILFKRDASPHARNDSSENPQTLAENYRMHALSDIPILTWKSRAIHRGDIYCLYILASLGYLEQSTTEIADRWATLASSLASPVIANVQSHLPDWELDEVDRRIASLLNLNRPIQRLLYNDHTVHLSYPIPM